MVRLTNKAVKDFSLHARDGKVNIHNILFHAVREEIQVYLRIVGGRRLLYQTYAVIVPSFL